MILMSENVGRWHYDVIQKGWYHIFVLQVVYFSFPSLSYFTLPVTSIFGLLRMRLVHLLDDLKGQEEVAAFAGLSVPDQLYLALVVVVSGGCPNTVRHLICLD